MTVGSRDALSGLGESLADVFHQTIETVRDITLEMPGARSPREAADIALRGDRKLHLGIVLLAMAAITMLIGSR